MNRIIMLFQLQSSLWQNTDIIADDFAGQIFHPAWLPLYHRNIWHHNLFEIINTGGQFYG